MAFDLSRLRTDQLLKLQGVGGDLTQLSTEELEELLESQEEMSDLGAGFQRAGGSFRQGIAGLLRDIAPEYSEELFESGARAIEETQRQRTPDIPSFKDIEDPLDLIEYTGEQLATSLPQLIAQLGTGAVATRLGGPRVGTAAAIGAGTPFFTGMNIERQIQEQGIDFKEADVAKAFGVSVGQSSLDALIGRYIGVFGPAKAGGEIVKATKAGLGKKVAKGAALGVAVEAPTEAAQQALEIIQAESTLKNGLDRLTSMPPEVQDELLEALVAGGLVGGTIGGAAGPLRPDPPDIAKRRDLEAHLAELRDQVAEDSRNLELFRAEAIERGLIIPPARRLPLFDDSDIVVAAQEKQAEAIREQEEAAVEQEQRQQDAVTILEADNELKAQEQRFNELYEPLIGKKLEEIEIADIEKFVAKDDADQAQLARALDALRAYNTLKAQRARAAKAREAKAKKRQALELQKQSEEETVAARELDEASAQQAKVREEVLQDIIGSSPDVVSVGSEVQLFQTILRNAGMDPTLTATETRLIERRKDFIDPPFVDTRTPEQTKKGQAVGVRESLKRLTSLQSRRLAEANAIQIRANAQEAINLGYTPEFMDRVRNIAKSLRQDLSKIGLEDVALKIGGAVQGDPSIEGMTDVEKDSGRVAISLAAQIYNPQMTDEQLKAKLKEVMNHETIHALRMLGVLTEPEYQSLVKVAKEQAFVDRSGKVRLFSYFERAQELYEGTEALQEEEAVAELFRDWAAGRKKIAGKPLNLFQKIIKFFKGLGKSLDSEQLADANRIFQSIESGEIGSRVRDRKGADALSPMQSRRATADSPAFFNATNKQIEQLIDRYDYPYGTTGYAVRMPIEDFMSLTYGVGKVNKADVKRVAKEFLEDMPSNDGSRMSDLQPVQKRVFDTELDSEAFAEARRQRDRRRARGLEVSDEQFARFDPDKVDNQNYMGVPSLKIIKDINIRKIIVDGHEGRHRTALAAIDGADTIPVQVEYKEFYTLYDSGRLFGTIPRGQDFDFEGLSAKRDVLQQYAGEDFPSVDGESFTATIPKGVPIFYKFRDELNKLIGPKSDPLYPDDAEGTAKLSKRMTLDEWLKKSAIKEPVYHATIDSFPALNPDETQDKAVHFAPDIETTDGRLEEIFQREVVQELEDGKVMFPRRITARIQMNNPLRLPFDLGNWGDDNLWRSALEDNSFMFTQRYGKERMANIIESRPDIQKVKKKLAEYRKEFPNEPLDADTIWLAIDSSGFDGIIYTNMGEGYGADSYLVWSPNQIYVEEIEPLDYGDFEFAFQFDDPKESMTPEELAEVSTRPVMGLQGRFLSQEDVGELTRDKDLFDERKRQFSGIKGTEEIRDPQRMFSRRTPVIAEDNPFDIDMNRTTLPLYPDPVVDENGKITGYRLINGEQFKPNSVKLTDAVAYLGRKVSDVLGTTDKVPYTDDNVEPLAKIMATEAVKALESDNNAIGWYDKQLQAAKRTLSLVEPRIFETGRDETAFDWALAVTSNGQAVTDNFAYALEAFRFYRDKGRFPVKEWKKGGDRRNQMQSAFVFFNEYQKLYEDGSVTKPIDQFLDSQFTVKQLQAVVDDMNQRFNTKISVPADELVDTVVFGSYIAGPKIGQGFYQNLRGNLDPLTMDIWWMRMWNRYVNRPFATEATPEQLRTLRGKIRGVIQNSRDEVIQEVVQDALRVTGIRKSDLRNNKTLDQFIPALRKSWDRYFRKFQKEQDRNPIKPQLFKDVKTLEGKLYGQIQATPTNGTERNYMRRVTKKAQGLLSSVGVDIETADLQALMWYPEKRLFEALGVRKGAGQDTDYAQAAYDQAKQEGYTDEQINEALSDPERGYVSTRTDPRQVDERTDTGTGQARLSKRYSASDTARRVANSAGADGQVWDVSRQSRGVDGNNVVASYSVNNLFAPMYLMGDISTPVVHELEQSVSSAEYFRSKIQQSKDSNPYGAAVYVYPVITDPDDTGYADMRLFVTDGGNAGFALKGNDIVSVFNTRGGGLRSVSYPLVRLAIEQGGRKLDAFDTILPEIYSANGMKTASRLVWDERQRPEGWRDNDFIEFNKGQPDVVFMYYEPPATEYKPDSGTYALDYAEALEIQDKAVRGIKDRAPEKSADALSSDGPNTIRFSKRFSYTGTPNPAGFSSFVDKVIAKDESTGPFNEFMRKMFGAAKGETLREAFVRNHISRFSPGYKLDDIVYGTSYNNPDSVGRAMEMSQQVLGRIYALMEFGPIKVDADGNVEQVSEAGVKGLNEIFAPLLEGQTQAQAKENERQFYAYAIARREKALRAVGRRGFQNLSDAEIDRAIAAGDPAFQKVFNDYQNFNNYMVQFGKDSGLLNDQMAEEFANMAYVPFYRLLETAEGDTDFSNSLPQRAANSLMQKGAFDRELVGSNFQVSGDLLKNIYRNNEMIISAGLRNIAMRKTSEALEKLQDPSWGEKADLTKPQGNVMKFRVNGEQVGYKIRDGALWHALSGLTPQQKDAYIKTAEMFANLLRIGVTNMPGFMVANLWRGKIDAYIKAGVPIGLGPRTLSRMNQSMKDGKDAMAIKLLTGFGGYSFGADPADFASTARRLGRTGGRIIQKDTPVAAVATGFKNLLQKVERFGESTELEVRIGLYQKLIAEGVSEREAAFQAMNLINYGRKGAGGGITGQLLVNRLIPAIPFLNARIQGLYRLAEDPRLPADERQAYWQGIMNRGLLVMAVSTALGALAMSDDRWEEESLQNKLNYDIIYIGDSAIKIPRAFELGAIFGTFPVFAVDAIRQEDGSDFAMAVAHTLFNTFAFNPIPQGVMPALEVVTGYDFFRMAPLEGMALQRKMTSDKFYSSTPHVYRFLSEAGLDKLTLSPLEIQQLLEGYMAGLATIPIAIAESVMSWTGAVPQKPNGIFGNPYVTDFGRVLGLARFIQKDGETSSQFVRDFYDLRRESDAVFTSYRDAAATGDQDRMNELLEDRGVAMGFRKTFNRVAKQLTDINNAMNRIVESPTMSPTQKTQQLRQLRIQKNKLARRIVELAEKQGI